LAASFILPDLVSGSTTTLKERFPHIFAHIAALLVADLFEGYRLSHSAPSRLRIHTMTRLRRLRYESGRVVPLPATLGYGRRSGRFWICEWPVPASTGVWVLAPFDPSRSRLVPFDFWAGPF
jgi:hypothetical protein